MKPTSNELALPSSHLLLGHLMREYGEPSHHGGAVRHVQFEVHDHDGVEQRLLVVQHGIGAAATYKIHVHESLNGRFESIYTTGLDSDMVTHRIKSGGRTTESAYTWPQSALLEMLCGCIGNKIY